jgi:hypothetical protein
MFGDEGFGVVHYFLEGLQIGTRARVAERDADVAEESAALDPLDGRPLEECAESGVVKAEKIA